MPSRMMHKSFIKDFYNRRKDKSNLILDVLEVYTEGPDTFYFDKKTYFPLGYRMHTNKTDEFFINFLNYIKENNLENNSYIISAYLGFLSHFVLDKTVHPFVYYKAGKYFKGIKTSKKYRNKHRYVETKMDVFYDDKKKIFKKHQFDKEFLKLLDDVLYKTHGFKDGSKYYLKCYKKRKFYYNYFVRDRFCIKRFLYTILDLLTFNFYDLSSISLCHKKDLNIMNYQHNIWNNPVNINMKSRKSVFDLYEDSIKELNRLYEDSLNYLKTGNKKYLNNFKGESYLTGLKNVSTKEFKYFEY